MQLIRRSLATASPSLQAVYGPVIAPLLASRGLCEPQQAQIQLVGLLHYQGLKGLDAALPLLVQALREQWHICIVGDFDVDGATSTALGMQALAQLGAQRLSYAVPNRFDYGYGLTPELVDAIAPRQPDLIITVDNGIAAFEGVARAQELGMRVLVTDHHLPGEQLPGADAIVNPNQQGCAFASKAACGCTVLFYLLSALRAQLQTDGWFVQQGLSPPNMAQFLDLVALATVADVVPLDPNNRTLVAQGLKRIQAGRMRPGIRALLQVANRSPQHLNASDLGFAIGPRLNAAGRLDDMALGIECLLAESDEEALLLAQQLDEFNQDRRQIEQEMQMRAQDLLAHLTLEPERLPAGLVLYDPNWHQGVIGILASRVKERWHRPVVALAPGEPGILKGSARSISGLHLRDALDWVDRRHPGLLLKFGGHAMAAGLSLKAESLPAFQEAFAQVVAERTAPEDLQAVLVSDGALPLALHSTDFVQALAAAGPWGQHCPEPVFDGQFKVIDQRLLQGKHLKLVVQHPEGDFFDAIAFNADTKQWPAPEVDSVLMAYRLQINHFRGEARLQLLVAYLAPVEAS